MQIEVTVEIKEPNKDGFNSSTFKKFIRIPEDTAFEDVFSLIPVALSQAAFQIVDKLKEGVE